MISILLSDSSTQLGVRYKLSLVTLVMIASMTTKITINYFNLQNLLRVRVPGVVCLTFSSFDGHGIALYPFFILR